MKEFNPNLRPGFLEVFCGPMKSGKSLELIHRVNKLKYMNDSKYLFFKPKLDTRDNTIRSRYGVQESCIIVENSNDILGFVKDEKLVAIDEAQFFDDNLLDVIKELLNKNINVVVAGLDLDFRGEPFGPMPSILSFANKVRKLNAICDFEGCNNIGRYTQRYIDGKPAHYDSPTILVGGDDKYEVRCRIHHEVLK
ncbi:MAG: thymidine kinase [Candidatus Woesearchaeota archaeon]